MIFFLGVVEIPTYQIPFCCFESTIVPILWVEARSIGS
jgi:hypothetical protein